MAKKKKQESQPVEQGSMRFNVTISPHVYEKLKRHAERKGLSVASMVRLLISEELNK